MNEQNPRDTHFAGFAKLLADELKVTGGYPISEVKQLIARRAYDLGCHILDTMDPIALQTNATNEEILAGVPDLAELPEIKEE